MQRYTMLVARNQESIINLALAQCLMVNTHSSSRLSPSSQPTDWIVACAISALSYLYHDLLVQGMYTCMVGKKTPLTMSHTGRFCKQPGPNQLVLIWMQTVSRV